jgi:acetyltransferase-like isoleucine patch superfamily enzyme
MTLEVIDAGKNNTIENHSGTPINGSLTLRGDNNHILFDAHCSADNCNISVGSNCQIRVGNKCVLSCIDIYCNDGAVVQIGDRSVFNYYSQLRCHEPSSIRIGPGFLCGAHALITTSDMHSIIDIDSSKRVNPAKNIVICENVWLGQDVYVLKGSKIGSGSVIGARSLVSGEISNNVVAAGVPARIIREGVTWKHDLS